LVKPYYDIPSKEYFERTFSKEVEDSELIWHRDLRDREITVLEGEGWKLQYDDRLPIDLTPGDKLFIQKMDFHRLWKGNTDLRLKIREL
jgi:quercetin dioxygenase-like cupin family protein